MPITVRCDCGRLVQAPDEAAGKKGRCPNCGESIGIPATSETAEWAGISLDPPLSQAPAPASHPRCPVLRLASLVLLHLGLAQFLLVSLAALRGEARVLEWGGSLAVLMIGFFGWAILGLLFDIARPSGE